MNDNISHSVSPRPFVHLHNHSHFSLLDGAQNIETMVTRAKDLGMTALGLTDHGNLHGSLKFYKECKKHGINPILGYEAYLTTGSRFDKIQGSDTYHLTVLAKNSIGWKNLIKLASTASLDGFYYKPRIDPQALEEFKDGLIILSGCVSSQTSDLVLNDKWDDAYILAEWYSLTFRDSFYMELMHNGTAYQNRASDGINHIANKVGLPTVATCDCHYTMPQDWDLQDTMVCISTGRPVSAPIDAPRLSERCYYLRPAEEVYAVLPDDACMRSQWIADQVDIEIETGVRHFPMYDVPSRLGYTNTPESHIRSLCYEGLLSRLGQTNAVYTGRLERELKVIHDLGFDEYFLIIADFCDWARNRGITSTARGSGVGSLVSYCLSISHVDPITHGLLFERFLDPSRREAPDIDVDFDKERRGEVIDYVKSQYGEDCVAQIGTFGTLGAKSAVKEVGKSFLLSSAKITDLVDSIPELPGTTLDDATEKNKKLGELLEDEKSNKVWQMARRIEGMARSSGVHAAGVVVGDRPLIYYLPLMRGKEGGVVTQWDMNDCEDIGLLKMDFLGLRNLTILSRAVRVIEDNHGIRININKLPQDDPAVYAGLTAGDTKGVFQLESTGMTDLLMRLRPETIEHICACIALYRPGPLDAGMVDEYVAVKNREKRATYAHPAMEQILGYTYGIMVYQEQVMMVLNQVGGIPLSESYSCIKAISKKIKAKVEYYKPMFVEGCRSNGVDGDHLWDQISTFARYGFNKSHSMAYAYIGYQTAWLKTHYPLEFNAALLDCDIDQRSYTGRDPMTEHLEDCERLGIPIYPPHVNKSGRWFKINDQLAGKGIAWSLAAVKGVPEAAAEAIEQAAPFTDLFDFCRRVPKSKCPRAAIRNLIAIGAMPGDQSRAVQDATIDRAMKLAAGEYKNPKKQEGKWSEVDEPWTRKQELEFEREYTGMYLTGHPILEFPYLQLLGAPTADLDGKKVIQAGVVTSIETRHTVAKGKEYTTFVLNCPGHTVDCVIWEMTPELQKFMVDGQLAVVRGRASAKGSKVGISVGSIDSPAGYLATHMFKIATSIDTFEECVAVIDTLDRHRDDKGTTVYIITPTHTFKYPHKVEINLGRLPGRVSLVEGKIK